ncbi:MAG: hypothetical protein VYC13_07220 [Actinomycetota bacterium]|nr:hypothetical protein [Acidimicrobiales bacterium]MEC8983556.1 hypothetical protein [Actinomycetota bacterium]MEC9057842.1 hypothetical protein [Actinomycetota bacterium]MEC9425970.1 hypothetical protein [Actinomycetota bacterium]MEC9449344.1 hypothetical protein [Actinomycetota bacterium]
MTPAPERRLSLRGAKLRALISDAVGEPASDLESDGDQCFDGTRLWVLANEDDPGSALGGAVFRSIRFGEAPMTVCFDDGEAAAEAARRADALLPAPDVRQVDGRRLVEVVPAEAPTVVDPPGAPDGFEDLCRSVGVEPVVEHGIWRGEVAGLEVVRVVDDPELGNHVQVGVGRFDREAGKLLHADQPQSESLAAAADLVRAHRRPGTGAHPLSTLCRERWLRRDLCADPSPVGLVDLEPVDPADQRANLRDPAPAPALGTDSDGRRVLVVCSVGVDPQVVSATAALVLRESPDRVVVALPDRDILVPVEQALARLRVPVVVVGTACGWEEV